MSQEVKSHKETLDQIYFNTYETKDIEKVKELIHNTTKRCAQYQGVLDVLENIVFEKLETIYIWFMDNTDEYERLVFEIKIFTKDFIWIIPDMWAEDLSLMPVYRKKEKGTKQLSELGI